MVEDVLGTVHCTSLNWDSVRPPVASLVAGRTSAIFLPRQPLFFGLNNIPYTLKLTFPFKNLVLVGLRASSLLYRRFWSHKTYSNLFVRLEWRQIQR
jgi:hypothetical protein